MFSLLLVLFIAVSANAQMKIGDPYTQPTEVTRHGDLKEPWGTVTFDLISTEKSEFVRQEFGFAPMPYVVTEFRAGSTRLFKTVFRAPIWHHGVDVMCIDLINTSEDENSVDLEISPPEAMNLGRTTGAVGNALMLALPAGVELERTPRDWGCMGGVVSMRGWGKPSRDCDPAFRNIAAGMGDVPIEYRFKVNPGESRNVFLGLCESFWGDSRRRPLLLSVEGSNPIEFNPLAAWGQHKPGCLTFAARDLNGDGYIDVVSSSSPKALDKVPILNVIWVFPPDTYPNTEEVLLGQHNKTAEHYVDVGGENDQSFFESGTVRYRLSPAPMNSVRLMFLLSSPAGGHVPNPETMVWNPDSLRKAGNDVWSGWFGTSEPSMGAMPEQFR